MLRFAEVVVVAMLALAGCSDSSEVEAGGQAEEGADATVVAAVDRVLGDEPFRSRTSGEIPFSGGGLDGIYEQSGGDLLDISSSGSNGSATAIVGETAYEWSSFDQSWTETPLDSFDPLLYPGFGFTLAMSGVFDISDEEFEVGDVPQVATGWTEVDGATDGLRRFERVLPSDMFIGTAGEADDAPVERLEENAIMEEFYKHAAPTAVVELDRGGNLVRYLVRTDFDGSPSFPGCGPLVKVTGTVEQVVEFSDVGVEFTIEVPDPAGLVAEYPLLGERPDVLDESLDTFDDAFTNAAGERDLTGCPTP